MTVLIDPSPLYDSVAAALRPLAGPDGTLAAPLTAAINAVVAAAEQRLIELTGDWAELQAANARLNAELLDVRASAAAEASRHETALRAASAAARHAVAAHADTTMRAQQRVSALEAVFVQAKARWDHEGGPELLREAIRAAETAA